MSCAIFEFALLSHRISVGVQTGVGFRTVLSKKQRKFTERRV